MDNCGAGGLNSLNTYLYLFGGSTLLSVLYNILIFTASSEEDIDSIL